MRPRRPLTERQEKVLRFIDEHTRLQGYPPSLREIATHIGGSSSNGAYDHIAALVKKGMVRRRVEIARGTVITAEGQCFLRGIDFQKQLG